MGRVKSGPPLPPPTLPVESKEIKGRATPETVASQAPLHTQSKGNSPAWQSFAEVRQPVPTKGEVKAEATPLRQRIKLAMGEDVVPAKRLMNPDSSEPVDAKALAALARSYGAVSPEALARELGVSRSRTALPPGASVKVGGSNHQPTVASPGPGRPTPLATARTRPGPTANPARPEARAAFEKILEQSHMPFDSRADNMARDVSNNPRLLGALTTAERGRMVAIMGDGIPSVDDQKGMMRTLGSAQSPQEFFQMVQAAGGQANIAGSLQGNQLGEFRFLMDKFSTDPGPMNSPMRKEARAAFERVLRQHYNPGDTRADNHARELVKNPALLGGLNAAEKGRLIRIMGSGWVGEGDEESVVNVLRASHNSTDFWTTVQHAGGVNHVNSLLDWKEQGQFNFLREKFSPPFSPMPQPQAAPQAGRPVASPMAGQPHVAPSAYPSNYGYQPQVAPMGNPYGTRPMSPYGAGGYGGYTPNYGMGMATGMGQPMGYGIGRAILGGIGRAIGGLFRGLVNVVGSLIRTAVGVAIPAGIGFLMGGPAGAAMGAAQGLMGQMGGMGMGMGGFPGSMMMQSLYSSMMGPSFSMFGAGALGIM